MPRRAWVGFVLAAALIVVSAGLAALPTSNGAESAPLLAPHVEGEIIIKFKSGVSHVLKNEIRNELGIVEVRALGGIRAEHTLIRDMTVAEALERYGDDLRVEYIEPNYILSSQALPNDPNFPIQWGLHNVGQTGGNPGADIMAAEAWDVTTGADNVVVAVIDSGIDYNHPDLAANVYLNAGEIPDNGVDDDNNGFIDDIRGWNFILQNNDPFDDNGHGSHVSGTIGAVGDNGLGITGVAWDVKIMALKFLNGAGLGSTAGAVECINYATLMGVDVINASWGGGTPSAALTDAIEAAAEADIVFVAAAGNGNPGVNNDLQPFIPASLPLDNIISVAASDDRDRLWTNSNFGLNSVDLAAPGVSIFSTVPEGGYGFLNGTSMAVPHVVGAIALIRGHFPALSAVEAKELLLDRSDHVDSLVGLVTGARRLNAFLPIASADEIPPARIDTLSTFNPESSRIDVSWIATGDDGDQGTATRHEIRYSTQPIDDNNFNTATPAEGLVEPRPAGSEEQLRVTGLQFSTTYYFAAKAFDEFGNASPLSNIASSTTAGPPSIAIDPGSFIAELFTGQTVTRTLTLDNSGLGEYAFSIQIIRPDDAKGAQLPFSLNIRDPGAQRAPATPSSQSYGPAYDPKAGTTPSTETQEITGIADGLRIMILQSGADVSQIKSQLSVMNDVAFVDEIDVRLSSPSLDDLSPFDAVIFIANNPVTDQVTVGNVLADYADAGGGVVMTLATLIDGWEVRGRFLEEGYYPIDLGPGALSGSALGDFDANHPIMQGVTEAQGELLGDISLATGAELVASWENGEPFVATKRGNVAAVNIFVSGNGFWSGDIPLVLRNAVFWTSNTIDWLSTNPSSGAVPAASILEVDVTFDAAGLPTGDYLAEIVLQGNDPNDPILRMQAELTVTGAPDLQVLPSSVDFGSLFLGDSVTRFLAITNTGTEIANVSSITSDNSQFSSAGSSLQVEPGQLVQMAVTYAPTEEGASAASLTFISDDPDEGELSVSFQGVGLVPPKILAFPGSFTADLFTGEIATNTLTVSNDGGSQLNVELTVQLVNPQPAGLSASSPAFAVGTPQPITEPEGAGPAGPPGERVDLSERASAQVFGEPFVFSEDFEDGVFDGWNEEQNINIKEVTDETAANGSNFSYHQINFIPGHFNGVARSIGIQQPTYASFYVRSSDTAENDSYFVVRALNGLESIFFFARDTGVFYCNLDVGGNSSVPYEADTWYFIEFRDINFAERHFDYYVNGALIQEDIPLRDTLDEKEFWEIDLYNFDDDSEAWWDEILIADEAPDLPIDIGPQSLSLAPGESADVTVTFNASGLSAGEVRSNIVLNSNDPIDGQLLIPAVMAVRAAADIDVSDAFLDWGSVFVGQSADQILELSNDGFETLTITQLSLDDGAFTADLTDLVLEPGESRELVLTFAPTSAGAHPATLTITSDDLDEGLVTVDLQALALIPPEIDVSPLGFQEELFTGELSSQAMTLVNNGGSDLVFEIRVESADTAGQGFSTPSNGFVSPSAGPEAAGLPFTLEEDFEDGDFFGWINAGGAAIKEVTDVTAANGTNFSYHEKNAAGGHFAGIYRILPNTRPSYVGFYIRPGSETTPDAYFALRDANGFEGIFFFAGPDGNFGINSNVGGDQSVPYTAETWYRIEFKQINWDSKTFDYYVNGQLIQELVPFRNPSLIGGFSRLDLYSFQPGAEAWWDEITVSTEEPSNPVSVDPIEGVIPAGESLDVAVNFNAKNLSGGDYPVNIVIESNVPDAPAVMATATLTVIEAPDIELTNDTLEFAPLFVGLSAERSMRVINDGTAPLTVTLTAVDGADFSADADAFIVAPSGNRSVTVTFTPSRDGTIAGTMTFESDDPDEAVVQVTLSGEGVLPPEIDVTPLVVESDLFTGQSAVLPLTLSNSGIADLTWQIAFPGDNQPHWLTVEPAEGTLAGTESVALAVTFNAAGLSGADLTAEILIQSNDPNDPEVSVPVMLHVTGAPDVRLSDPRLNFGDVFLETTRSRRLIVSNDGVEDLVVSKISVDNLDFDISTTGFSVAPGGGSEIQVSFTPPGLGTVSGLLTLVTNDPDAGVLTVPLTATGSLPPVAAVNPISMSADILSGERMFQTLSLSNSGGSDLTYSISVEERVDIQFPASEFNAADGNEPWVDIVPRTLTAPETAGAPVPLAGDIVQMQAGPTFVDDNFEDGNFDGWEEGVGEGVRLVTSATAADDTRFSYQEAQSSIGHLDGLHQVFGPAQPGYIGFWVRPGNEAAEDAYFVVRDSQGLEVIWFFARSTGRFFVNADVGGDELVTYNQNTWYHIEFRNISFFTQRFDYYINGERIKKNIPVPQHRRNLGHVSSRPVQLHRGRRSVVGRDQDHHGPSVLRRDGTGERGSGSRGRPGRHRRALRCTGIERRPLPGRHRDPHQ